VLSDRNWKLESVLRLVLGIFLCLCVGTLLAALVRGSATPQATPSVARIVISTLTFQGAALVLIWRFLREHQTGWVAGFGLQHDWLKAAGLGLIAALLFLPLGWGTQVASIKLMEACGLKYSEQLALVALRNSGSAPQLIVMGVVTIIGAAGRGTLFRGILFPAVKQHGYPRAAFWGTRPCLALIHLSLAIFIPLTACWRCC
jgi:membrane protease YdiL (CAAX protease family)